MSRNLVALLIVMTGICAIHACGPDPAGDDAGADVTISDGSLDSGADSGAPDAGLNDSGKEDSGTSDSGADDTGVADTGADDSGIDDAGTADANPEDSGYCDTGTVDAEVQDSGTDAEVHDSGHDGSIEDASIDTFIADSGFGDTGSADVENDSGYDAGLPDAGHDGGREYYWYSTYNCAEWTSQGKGSWDDIPGCGGVQSHGVGATSNGHYEQVTAGANYPGGGGGRGQRHWIGSGRDNQSGGSRVVFPEGLLEVWVRFYMRMQAGFTFDDWISFKILYFKTDGFANSDAFIGGSDPVHGALAAIPVGAGSYRWFPSNPGFGFIDIWNGAVSDGSWHAY